MAATLLVAGGVSACNASSGAEGETKTIRYQSYTGMVDPAELADALGYFDGTGIQLDRIGDVQGGPESLRAAATNQVDYGAAFNGAIAKLASTGAPIKAVVAYYGTEGDVSGSLLVKKGSQLDEASDFVGKKIAVNTLGANNEAVLDTYFVEEGLTQDEIDQITLVPLPSINTEAALREGQVDAGYLSNALKEAALQRGGLTEVVNDLELIGPYNGGSFAMTERFIAQNPTTTQQFVEAVAKAVDYAQSHSVDEVREVMQGYLEEHDRGDYAAALDLWRGTGVPSKGGVVRDEDFTLWLEWLEAEGEVEAGSIEPSELYTNEYNPFAKED
ncbi:ABC transporter substrate-binding protein [Nocardioides sp.]|uniref:ABC transporter substrate-binding protein n=1 Tax=Nocardioides sp. TaxID=35761 RepID=UPI002ED57C44